jgi:N-carbamoyl-L-amino-acid hydrolase
VCRIALTDEDKAGRDQVVQWFQEAGLAVRIDEVGNVFGRRAGTDPQARAVATGSHIDTQPTGGKFDGNYGVMAGLEVVRTLNAQGIQTVAPLEVAFWTNEEGTRFTPVMMGSGAFAGVFVRKTSARNKMVQASPWGRAGTHRLPRHSGLRRCARRPVCRLL